MGHRTSNALYVPLAEAKPARRRRTPALVPVAATVALAAVIAIATISAGGRPDVETLASISERPATQPTPGGDGTLLDREFEGVSYPDWSREFGWMADGGRSDTFGGRRAETVFYTHHGHRIAYTVVEGDALEPPDGATTLNVDGVTLHRFRDGPRDVVTFERDGRTCVLSGDVLARETLIALAAWRPGMPGSRAHAQA
jgi:hypothetical protein